MAPPDKTTVCEWTQLCRVGLLLNPDLNKARLKLLVRKNTAKYAALWEDPSFTLDAARYLPGVEYDRAFALGLSIPVSGRTTLARKVAELYAESDLHELQAQEQDYRTRLRTLCYIIRITHTKHALMRHRIEQAQQELLSLSRLHDDGEISTADLHTATQRCSDLLKDIQELENTHLSKHLELTAMLGLHPETGELEISGALPVGVPDRVATPTEQELLHHPRLLAAMSAYRTTEAELQLEIRKQYPDISLSPGYGIEEGDKKLTLGVGFTLPLWNRNREAIARSRGARAQSRLDALSQFRELIQQAHALSRRQDLTRKHCLTEYERLTALHATTDRLEHLFTLGEVGLPALADTRHETYARRLAYLDCLAELLEIQVALHALSTSNAL